MRRVDYHTVLTSVVCFAIATLRGTRVPGVSRSRCSRLRGGVSLWRVRARYLPPAPVRHPGLNRPPVHTVTHVRIACFHHLRSSHHDRSGNWL